MNIDKIISNYLKAKNDIEKYRLLIQEHQQEFIDKHVIGKCFISKEMNEWGSNIKYFIYKVNKIEFLKFNMFDFDIYGEHVYKLISRENDEGTERISRYDHFIDSCYGGIRVDLSYPNNIYEFFSSGDYYKEYSEEDFFKELNKNTYNRIPNIETLPKFDYLKY